MLQASQNALTHRLLQRWSLHCYGNAFLISILAPNNDVSLKYDEHFKERYFITDKKHNTFFIRKTRKHLKLNWLKLKAPREIKIEHILLNLLADFSNNMAIIIYNVGVLNLENRNLKIYFCIKLLLLVCSSII